MFFYFLCILYPIYFWIFFLFYINIYVKYIYFYIFIFLFCISIYFIFYVFLSIQFFIDFLKGSYRQFIDNNFPQLVTRRHSASRVVCFPIIMINDWWSWPCYTHKCRKCRKRRNLGWTNVTPPQTSQSRVDKRHTTH